MALGAAIAAADIAVKAAKIGSKAKQDTTETTSDIQMGDDTGKTAEFKRNDLEEDKEEEESTPTLGVKEDTPEALNIADISEKDFTPEEEEVETPELSTENNTPFDKTPEDNSSESEATEDKVDKIANIVASTPNSTHTADTSAYSSGGINGASAVGSSDTGAYEPLQLPPISEGVFSKMMGPDSPETKSMLQEAEEAYSNDEDIDDDELNYTDEEQAAEDVEDVVQADIPEEVKEEVLEKSAEDDGKIDEGEILDNAVEVAVENTPETEEEKESLKDKIKDTWGKVQPLAETLYYLFNPKSTSEGESLSMGSDDVDVAGMKDADISTEGEGDTFTSSSGGAPGAGSASGYSGSKITSDTSSGNVDGRVSSSAGRGTIDNTIAGKSSSGAASSGAGSIRAAFDKIVSGGIDSGTTTGESSFEDSGMSEGNVGSVEVKGNDEPLQIGNTQNGTVPVNTGVASANNPAIDTIHEVVAEDWENWPERDGVHYKDKGSIGIFTENGEDVFVKLGTRRIQPLENIDSSKLEYVTEVLK